MSRQDPRPTRGVRRTPTLSWRRQRLERRGAAVLMALTVLVILGVAVSLALRANVAARRQSRLAAESMQTEYLAAAGIELAEARLRSDADYLGETWNIPADELGGRHGARVVIRVVLDDAGKTIESVAEFPANTAPELAQRRRLCATWNESALLPQGDLR